MSDRPAGVILGFMMPHPWIMVAGEREGGLYAQTTTAFRRARAEVARLGVDLLLVASPHWEPAQRLRIGGAPRYAGTHSELALHIQAALPAAHRREFPPVEYDFPGGAAVAARLCEAGRRAGLPVQIETQSQTLPPGALVPLIYLNPKGDLPVLPLSIEEGPRGRSRRWGEIIGREVRRAGRRAALVSSSTLSHHFIFDRPDSLWPPGEAWDRRLLGELTQGDPEAILKYSEEEIAAGELETGGLHGLYMLLGALGPRPSASVLSYEGIVGVGSPVVRFEPRRSSEPGKGSRTGGSRLSSPQDLAGREAQ